MMRLFTAGALVAALGSAPLQCKHDPDPNLRREDTAGDALYALAQDFRAKGNEAAAKETLRFLVERYPSNRHVPAAKAELEGPVSADADAGK
jgi:hypothetical protein